MPALTRELFVADKLGVEYPDLIKHVLRNGEVIKSRVGETTEILNFRLELEEPQFCLVGRDGMSDDFAREEIYQLLAGVHDNERLAAVAPRAAELITFPTAYGPRVWPQLQYVCDELENSFTSRRAVVYVGRDDDLEAMSDKDNAQARANEMPCTCVWQFHARGETLDMSVYMRSWDLVWGLSYDVPSFVAVQHAVTAHLGLSLGTYTHTAGSAHVYDRHYRINLKKRWDVFDAHGVIKHDIALTRAAARVAIGWED